MAYIYTITVVLRSWQKQNSHPPTASLYFQKLIFSYSFTDLFISTLPSVVFTCTRYSGSHTQVGGADGVATEVVSITIGGKHLLAG
jgi:hypothetical protein